MTFGSATMIIQFILILLAIVAVLLLTGGIWMFRSMFISTAGKKIADYPHPRKALMVLDLQEGYDGRNPRQPATGRAAGGIFGTVNRLIALAAESDMEVIYVRQVFSNNLFVRLHGGRRAGKVIVDRRINKINDNDFEKNRTDAFSNRQLEQFLVDRQVNKLYLAGVDAAYCVYATARGGLQRGYRVTVVIDAVASRTSMHKVIERYSHKGIGIVSSSELLATSASSDG